MSVETRPLSASDHGCPPSTLFTTLSPMPYSTPCAPLTMSLAGRFPPVPTRCHVAPPSVLPSRDPFVLAYTTPAFTVRLQGVWSVRPAEVHVLPPSTLLYAPVRHDAP